MTENDARGEICRVGESLFSRGHVHATAGNISVRLDAAEGGGYLITPTDACLGRLDPARLARVNDEGRQLSGDPASKTLALHRQIYDAARTFDAATCCVIHTHATHCVLLSLDANASDADELIPAITPYFVMKVGHVPMIRYDRPGAPEVGERVAQAIRGYGARGTPIRAVMLERLGPNVWHDSPARAMATLEELEETARLLALRTTPPVPLTATDIEALRRAFGARW